MDAKMRFISAYYRQVPGGLKSMSELCGEYGIARKTGYELLERHTREGLSGLVRRSRAPHGGPHWYKLELIARVLELRQQYPHWGAETILIALQREDPETEWPAASTVHGWLRHAGLVYPCAVAAVFRIRASRVNHPLNARTSNGASTSKVTSEPAMGGGAIR